MRFGISCSRLFAVACAAVFLCGRPATAFYWSGWPGSGDPPTPQIVVTPKPTPVLTFTEVTIPKIVPNPSVPEPGTLVAAAIGLATVGVRAMRLRKRGR